MAEKFRKKPVEIEAMQYDGRNVAEIMVWMGASESSESFTDDDLTIKTLEGDMRATSGDWIIKGVKGEFYPCKPDIFEATYEPANQSPPSEKETE